MNGVITISGKNYVQRPETIPYQQTLQGTLDVAVSKLVFPGVADFLLTGLSCDTLQLDRNPRRRFKFRFGNSDGNIWYSQAPNNIGASDRVLDTLIFGIGPFPFQLPTPIVFGANSSMMLEFEDVRNQGTPYTLSLAFLGSWLLPTGN